MCACVCTSMGACVCVHICVDLMGFGRDLDKRIQVLSGNNYLSLTKSNKKERKRKPTHINFLIEIHHAVPSTEQRAPVTETL